VVVAAAAALEVADLTADVTDPRAEATAPELSVVEEAGKTEAEPAEEVLATVAPLAAPEAALSVNVPTG